VTPLNMMQVGFALMLVVQGLILSGWGPVGVLWFALGVLSSVNAQAYLATSSYFPKEAFGRVSTAINLMAFLGAFGVQWGLGIALDALQQGGMTVPGSLRAAFAGLILLQAVSLLPLLFGGRKRVRA